MQEEKKPEFVEIPISFRLLGNVYNSLITNTENKNVRENILGELIKAIEFPKDSFSKFSNSQFPNLEWKDIVFKIHRLIGENERLLNFYSQLSPNKIIENENVKTRSNGSQPHLFSDTFIPISNKEKDSQSKKINLKKSDVEIRKKKKNITLFFFFFLIFII